MGMNSKIEWTHHTFNPWWGCIRVSPACKHCYADSWAKRLGVEAWGANSERKFFTDAHWLEPIKWNREADRVGERRRVFCASMGDVFENRRDLDAPRERLWSLIEATPSLDWLLLTKRIQHVKRLAPWSGKWPKNIWLGTSTETQKWLEKRVDHLLMHDAVVRFISAEPLLGPLAVSSWLAPLRSNSDGINWVIAGGESGAHARTMNPLWAESLRDQCREAKVPFHFKQWGHWAPEEIVKEGYSARVERVEVVGKMGQLIRMVKIGKTKSGRTLDGATWDQFPLVA
jgi:protein gp37